MNSISNKIKLMLVSSGKKQKELAEYLKMSPQTLNNKFSRGSWSVSDLIKVADFCGGVLSVDISGTKILLDPQDLPEIKKESL